MTGFRKNLIGLHGKRHDDDAFCHLFADERFSISIVDNEYSDGYVFTRTPSHSLVYALPNLSSQDNGERTMLVCHSERESSRMVPVHLVNFRKIGCYS